MNSLDYLHSDPFMLETAASIGMVCHAMPCHAMPCHATDIWTFGRGVFNSSRHISDVEYDSGRAPLASTSRCDDAEFDFLVDHVLFQAGGIVIRYLLVSRLLRSGMEQPNT
jgi:hypothetical protein